MSIPLVQRLIYDSIRFDIGLIDRFQRQIFTSLRLCSFVLDSRDAGIDEPDSS